RRLRPVSIVLGRLAQAHVAGRSSRVDNPRNGRDASGATTMDRSPTAIAALVEDARLGDEEALAALIPLVYDELRRLAASYLRRERPGQTLQATALVHDVYLRLLRDSHLSWQNR